MTLQTMSFVFGAIMLAVGILGGGFEVKEIKISNVTTAARIFATLVGIVFIGLWFWQSSASTEQGSETHARATMSEREHDTDRIGSDYTNFDVDADHVERCEDACKNDTKCLAWTYVKPGLQGQNAHCWLKNIVPASSKDTCCLMKQKARPSPISNIAPSTTRSN